MAEARVRKLVSTTFKLNGFSILSDAASFLVSQLMPFEEREREEWLDKIVEHIQKQCLETTNIGKDNIELAIHECIRSGAEESETILTVINAFEVPRFEYNQERKKFFQKTTPKDSAPKLFDSAEEKAQLFRYRYILLHQRTARHELFTPSAVGSNETQKFTLRPVDYFLSSSRKVDDAVVMGLLTQLKEGKYYLEDTTGTLQLDLSETRYHTGLHVEGCFVLAEGWYEDRVFHVNGMGFPPPESSRISRDYFGNMNTFGGPSSKSLKLSKKLLKIEEENEDATIVFIADVWLDNVKVLEKLSTLFQGYSECPPVAFVLMGNFLSSQHGSAHAYLLKEKFKILGDLIVQFPKLTANSKFIFIPGPVDPAFASILPRPPLPTFVTEELKKKLPSAIFSTSPCRIQYCTQEIVVIREDLVTKMCRNTIYFPTSGDIPQHFAKTIISQAHLAPLPLAVCPVYWGFDYGMQLYPLPDLIVTADQFNAFTTSYSGCQVINPSSFPRSNYSFKVYLPASRQIEDSQIPND
ncbi:DNA polymerase epsilon subunit 2 isoform X1 [Schistocerca americana]|uniref:DNA polymerase epsilon subunit 2 isoform X1 n=2 Tax=Schistocerca americana TaxID=7009 RepID=UPI001F4F176D|nr:DNA polymerase epsilon subunit 2 isoform X1 [Schistocerca americana]